MASLVKVLENGLKGWWRTLVNKRSVILEAKHHFSSSFLDVELDSRKLAF
jgi:hypothetical protein